MAKRATSKWSAIREQLRSWGVFLPPASGPVVAQAYIRVYVDHGGESILVGRLYHRDARGGHPAEFVFQYDAGYVTREDAIPISAFPELSKEYTSQELWPFFAVRIPPVHRRDVREALEKQAISEDQTLRILGLLAATSVSNPYKLELAEAS